MRDGTFILVPSNLELPSNHQLQSAWFTAVANSMVVFNTCPIIDDRVLVGLPPVNLMVMLRKMQDMAVLSHPGGFPVTVSQLELENGFRRETDYSGIWVIQESASQLVWTHPTFRSHALGQHFPPRDHQIDPLS